MDLDDDEEEGGIESRGDEMFRVRQAGRHALPDLGRFRYVQVGQAADSERPPGGSVPSEPVLRCRLYKEYQYWRANGRVALGFYRVLVAMLNVCYCLAGWLGCQQFLTESLDLAMQLRHNDRDIGLAHSIVDWARENPAGIVGLGRAWEDLDDVLKAAT